MRDNHDTTLEFLDCSCESIDGVHIEVVCWFVKKQDVRVLHRQLGENNTIKKLTFETKNRKNTHRFLRPSDNCLMGDV
jgi:hypothetical protein